MAIIDFGGTKEEVIMRSEFPMEKARKVLKNETIAVIGYGVQGPGQSLNLKDNGFNVIIGQSKQFKRTGTGQSKMAGNPVLIFLNTRSRKTRYRHRNAGFGCRPEANLAGGQKEPETGRCPLFLSRLLHCL